MKFKTCMCPPVLCPFLYAPTPFDNNEHCLLVPKGKGGWGSYVYLGCCSRVRLGLIIVKTKMILFVSLFYFVFFSLKMWTILSFHLGFPKEVLVFIVFSFPSRVIWSVVARAQIKQGQTCISLGEL